MDVVVDEKDDGCETYRVQCGGVLWRWIYVEVFLGVLCGVVWVKGR